MKNLHLLIVFLLGLIVPFHPVQANESLSEPVRQQPVLLDQASRAAYIEAAEEKIRNQLSENRYRPDHSMCNAPDINCEYWLDVLMRGDWIVIAPTATGNSAANPAPTSLGSLCPDFNPGIRPTGGVPLTARGAIKFYDLSAWYGQKDAFLFRSDDFRLKGSERLYLPGGFYWFNVG